MCHFYEIRMFFYKLIQKMCTNAHFHSGCLQLVQALFVQKFKICLYKKVAEYPNYPDDLWMQDDVL